MQITGNMFITILLLSPVLILLDYSIRLIRFINLDIRFYVYPE